MNTAKSAISEKRANFIAPVVVGLARFASAHRIDWIVELISSKIFIASLFASIAVHPLPVALFSAPVEQNKLIIFLVFFITAPFEFELAASRDFRLGSGRSRCTRVPPSPINAMNTKEQGHVRGRRMGFKTGKEFQ